MLAESPFWWNGQSRVAPAAPARLDLSRVDVAIVGGGYTGLSAARTLARSGARVAVFERERVGWGASSRNGGQVLTGLKLDPVTLAEREGEDRLAELFATSIEAIGTLEDLIADEGIDCNYLRTGHVQAACRPAHFRAFREEQALLARVCNHCVELIGAADQRSELGSGAYHGVMVDERSGALDPAGYVDGLARASRRAGAQLVEGASVERILPTAAGWTLRIAGGATVDAGHVLIAANGYTDAAADWLRRRVVPIGSYAIVTETLAPDLAAALLPTRRMAFDSRHFLHYFRLTADNRLLFGGRAIFAQPTRDTIRRSAAILARDMRAVFPELAETRVEFAWQGTVGLTRDQLPHAGTTPGGLHYAVGYCGHGVAMATFLGALAARHISGEQITHPLWNQPWPAIPLYNGRPWFLPVVGAYYRVRDWLD